MIKLPISPLLNLTILDMLLRCMTRKSKGWSLYLLGLWDYLEQCSNQCPQNNPQDSVWQHLSFIPVPSLYYLSNLDERIAPFIWATIRKRKKTKMLQYLQDHGSYRTQEPCYVNGPTEVILSPDGWQYYNCKWDSSRENLILIFYASSKWKIVRCYEGLFNYGFRLSTSTTVIFFALL